MNMVMGEIKRIRESALTLRSKRIWKGRFVVENARRRRKHPMIQIAKNAAGRRRREPASESSAAPPVVITAIVIVVICRVTERRAVRIPLEQIIFLE